MKQLQEVQQQNPTQRAANMWQGGLVQRLAQSSNLTYNPRQAKEGQELSHHDNLFNQAMQRKTDLINMKQNNINNNTMANMRNQDLYRNQRASNFLKTHNLNNQKRVDNNQYRNNQLAMNGSQFLMNYGLAKRRDNTRMSEYQKKQIELKDRDYRMKMIGDDDMFKSMMSEDVRDNIGDGSDYASAKNYYLQNGTMPQFEAYDGDNFWDDNYRIKQNAPTQKNNNQDNNVTPKKLKQLNVNGVLYEQDEKGIVYRVE